MAGKSIKLGTRGSKLALYQTNMVAAQLQEAHPDIAVEIVEIKTSGDWNPSQGETRLSEAEGGKGLFAREIERALVDGHIDCGVHSMKDMPSFLPDGLVIEHMLRREDPGDAFLSNHGAAIDDLPQGATVGTSSMRRQAFMLARRPDLHVVPFRGNVPTRIEKLRNGQVDATVLAMSGLKRLGLTHEVASVIPKDIMLPAAGQGAVGIEIREDDDVCRTLLQDLHCKTTFICVEAERAALQVLDGSCHTPIGSYAVLSEDEVLTLHTIVAAMDGLALYSETLSQPVTSVEEARLLGTKAGEKLKAVVPPDILAA